MENYRCWKSTFDKGLLCNDFYIPFLKAELIFVFEFGLGLRFQ